MLLNKQLEEWVKMGDGSRKMRHNGVSLRVILFDREKVEVEGVTWVLSKLFIV
jgi:hypothetical protein